jgi:hypothetical protein
VVFVLLKVPWYKVVVVVVVVVAGPIVVVETENFYFISRFLG